MYLTRAALSDYAPTVEMFTGQLLTRLRNENGKSISLLPYMSFYSYDVMAKLAFGNSFGYIIGEQSDAADNLLNIMTNSLFAIGVFQHMPWLMNTLGVIFSFAGPMKTWTDWTVGQMRARMAVSLHVLRARNPRKSVADYNQR